MLRDSGRIPGCRRRLRNWLDATVTPDYSYDAYRTVAVPRTAPVMVMLIRAGPGNPHGRPLREDTQVSSMEGFRQGQAPGERRLADPT